MQCPKCHSVMAPVTHSGCVVHRCTQCAGMWFEPLDHERLKDAAAEIDPGDAEVGARYNHIDRIECPRCAHWRLIPMVDAQQPHIWFESCKHCYGRFYDAGEFRDFADHSLAKFFDDLTAPERQ